MMLSICHYITFTSMICIIINNTMQLEKYNYNTINYKYCCFLFLCSGTILMKTSGYQVNRTCYQGLYELKTTFKTKHSH